MKGKRYTKFTAQHWHSATRPSTTAAIEKSALLRLPRELRNEAYSYVTTYAEISEPNPWPLLPSQSEGANGNHQELYPAIYIENTTAPSLLRVNRQIHDEYAEHIRARTRLSIEMGSCNTEHLLSLKFKAKVPESATKGVKAVVIHLPWTAGLNTGAFVDRKSFMDSLIAHDVRDQRSMVWTPSKALKNYLLSFISRVQNHVHPDASVNVRIDMTDFPDPQDPFTWQIKGTLLSARVAMMATQTLHMDTLLELERDSAIAWPGRGKLRVCGSLYMPMWCSMAKNSAEVLSSRRAWERGEMEHVEPPVHESSNEHVEVWLSPTSGENNWRGYWPWFGEVFGRP